MSSAEAQLQCALCNHSLGKKSKFSFLSSGTNSCTCKRCHVKGCKETIAQHCSVCLFPTCSNHSGSVESEESNEKAKFACSKCSKEVLMLQEAGDTARLQKILKFAPKEDFKTLEEFILNICINGQYPTIKIHIRIHPKCHEKANSGVYNSLRQQIATIVGKHRKLYSLYNTDANGIISPATKAPVIDYPSMDSLSIHSLDVELPLISNTLNLTKNEAATLLRSNQCLPNDCGPPITLLRTLEVTVSFYKAYSSSPLPCTWITKEEAIKESKKWSTAAFYFSRMETIRAMTEKAKIGTEIAKLVSLLKKSITEGEEICLPVTWMQEYEITKDMATTIKKVSGLESDEKEKVEKSPLIVNRAMVWVLMQPDTEHHISLSFVNTADVLSTLFPKCTQAHIPKSSRKNVSYSAYSPSQTDESTSLSSVTEGLGSILGLDGAQHMLSSMSSLHPGVVGTVNKLQFSNVPVDFHLDSLFIGLFLMQLSSRQRAFAANSQLLTDGMSTLTSLFAEKGDEEQTEEKEESATSLLDPMNLLKQTSIRSTVGAALRHRVGISAPLAFEEEICNLGFDGRSFVDGKLLEGHSFHILEAILSKLSSVGTMTADPKSVYPLTPSFSDSETFYLYERFTTSKSKQLRIQIIRSIFILRSALPALSPDLLRSASQQLYALAMANPHIFGDEMNSTEGLLGLKGSLDKLIALKMKSESSIPVSSLANPTVIPMTCEYGISMLVPCYNQVLEGALPSVTSRDIYWPTMTSAELQTAWFSFPYAIFDAMWTRWMEEATSFSKQKDYASLRKLIKTMVDSLPEDWAILESKISFQEENMDKEDPQVTSQLWINRWALLLLRINQFISVGVFDRLGSNLRNKSGSKKYGLKPEDLLSLTKLAVLIDKLYCLPFNEDIEQVAPHRPPCDWKAIVDQISTDHYVHMLSATENLRLQGYVLYLQERTGIQEGHLSCGPQGWSTSNEESQVPNEDLEELTNVLEEMGPTFDRSVLQKIVDRAVAYYGGPIPDKDHHGNENMGPDLIQAISAERGKHSHEVDKTLKIENRTYTNLRFPDKKKKVKSGFLASLLEEQEDTIAYDHEWENTSSIAERSTIKINRQKAHTWLYRAYHRILFPTYQQIAETWFNSHIEDLKLNEVETILKNHLIGMNTSHLDFGSMKHREPIDTAIKRDSIMLELSKADGVDLLVTRSILSSLLLQFNRFKSFLGRFSRLLSHWCCKFAVSNWIQYPQLKNVKPTSFDLDSLVQVSRAFIRTLSSLHDSFTSLLSENTIQCLQITKEEQKTIQVLLDSLHTWWCGGEFAIFNSAEQLQSLFGDMAGEQVEGGHRECNIGGKTTLVEIPICASPGIKNAIDIMQSDFFRWQAARHQANNKKAEFDEDRDSMHRHMVLVSEPLKIFWPPSLFACFTMVNLTRFLMKPRSEIFFDSYSSIVSPVVSTVGSAAKSVVHSIFTDSKLMSGRQAEEQFIYATLTKFREAMASCIIPTIEYISWDLLGVFSNIAKNATGSKGVQWFLGLRLDSSSVIPLLSKGDQLQPTPSSHYIHGVQLSKTVRNQLVRGGIDNRMDEGISSISLLAESVATLPCLDGETDLCQEMRFDHLSTTWIDKTMKQMRLYAWGLGFSTWENFGKSNKKLQIPALFHHLRHTREENSFIQTHWQREASFSGSTLITSLLGDLSLDRINYVLCEAPLQRVLEMKLFRPTVLPLVCSTKPQFMCALITLFHRSIETQKQTNNISGEVYLRFILFRIGMELGDVRNRFAHITRAQELILHDSRLEFPRRIQSLFNKLMAPFLIKEQSISLPKKSILHIHSFSIHKYFLLWIKASRGTAISPQDSFVPKMIASFTNYRSGAVGLPPTEVDLHEIQCIEDWMFSLFQSWKEQLCKGSVGKALVSDLLYPTASYFLSTEQPTLLSALSNASWEVSSYPTFSTRIGDTYITIEPAAGYLFLNGAMRTFVKHEHAIHEHYQRFFGLQLLPCSFRRKGEWDVYQCKLMNQITGQMDEYTIQGNRGDLTIFRSIPGKSSTWYQYLPGGLTLTENFIKEEEPFPGFLQNSDAWISCKRSNGNAFFSYPKENAANTILHHSISFQKVKGTNEPHIRIQDIHILPSNELVTFMIAKQLPKGVSSFEDAQYIEIGSKSIYFTRYRISFAFDSATQVWRSIEYPGFQLSDSLAVDPFSDSSSYWLTLEKKSDFGLHTFLLLASAMPLLPYPAHKGPGIGMANYRHKCRSVWIDQVSSSQEVLPHFTMNIDLEYPTILRTSSSIGQCWLALLYLAKRDYFNSYIMIHHINFATDLQADQLEQLHRILHWYDNSHNGCIIKLKIISALAKNDVLLFANAESETKKGNSVPLQGRYPQSLLGMTQEQFFDLYITCMKGSETKSSVLTQSTKIPVHQPELKSAPAGAVINLSKEEWSYINRALARWERRKSLQIVCKQELAQTRSIIPSRWINSHHRLGEIYHNILGNTEGVADLLGVSLRDVAFEIISHHVSTSKEATLITKMIPYCIGRPGRNWEKYFMVIYQRIVFLDKANPLQLSELATWKFLLASEPYAGDRISRICKILLYKAACLREAGQDGLLPFPKKFTRTRTKLTKLVGLNTFGTNKKQDSEFLDSIELLLQTLDDSFPLPDHGDRAMDILSSFIPSTLLPPSENEHPVALEEGDEDEDLLQALANSMASFANEGQKDTAPSSNSNIQPENADMLHAAAMMASMAGAVTMASTLANPDGIAPLLEQLNSPNIPTEGKPGLENEIIFLESLLAKRYEANGGESNFRLYGAMLESLEGLEMLREKTLQVNKYPRNARVWNERSELLFNERHYDTEHHKKAAKLLQTGFDKAWAVEEISVAFKEPEVETIGTLKKGLYQLRAKLESEEAALVREVYGLIRGPGLVTGSSVCADQAVPLSILLFGWENNDLDSLEDYTGLHLPISDQKKLSTLLESIDIKICWRYHIGNILTKINAAHTCSHVLEKAALMETIYHLFNEKLCYDSTHQDNAPHNRKILAISRSNGFLVRKKQVDIVNTLLQNPNQAVQAALGLGKSSVIVPLATNGMADGCNCLWILCPLTDKPETISRCESVRSVLNHSLLVFHFENDGTMNHGTHTSDENIAEEMGSEEQTTTSSTTTPKQCLSPPYKLDSIVHVKELYYDLLRITIEKGLVITTRESLLYFVDCYEQLWITRSKHRVSQNEAGMSKCDELIDWFSKFFPFFKKHCRAILDEIDEILKSNVKVNIALSDMAKINRDTLQLAVASLQMLLDPTEYIEQSNEKGEKISIPLPSALALMSNCQAAVPAELKQNIREKIASHIGSTRFGFDRSHPATEHYLSFVLCLASREQSETFYHEYIVGTKKNPATPHAANIVRLRELLSGSFATLFKRHNYSLGRMFTNDNKDDVGPYSAANSPLKNSHLSSEYDWAWALAANYAQSGITLAQFSRYVNRIRIEAMSSTVSEGDLNGIRLNHQGVARVTPKDRCQEFKEMFSCDVLDVSKEMLPSMLLQINHVGDWSQFEAHKVKKCLIYLQREENKSLRDKVSPFVPRMDSPEEISPYQIERIGRTLFHSPGAKKIWPELLSWCQKDIEVGREAEEHAIEIFKKGISTRLNFLVEFVNLTYYPSFIEGNASTITHIFSSACGFSGTMEVPQSLPQLVYCQSEPELMRDRSIDGVILSKFLKFSLGEEENSICCDSTAYVDEAAENIVARRFKGSGSARSFIGNRTREVLLSSYNCQALVDGGALLDVDPQEIIHQLVEDRTLLGIIQDPSKKNIKTIRWKENGNWTTIDVQTKRKQLQQHRAEPLDLASTLTFYDQQHSRGTDAKLSPDALMVNTVGDETRLTEWSQAEGRARQSGKGQTSKSILAPHTRPQQQGEGPLAIRMLRTLVRRSSNSEVSEAFYAHAEQLRSYLRDYFRSSISEYIASCHVGSVSQAERDVLCLWTETLFVHQCDADVTQIHILHETAKPQQYTSSSNCLGIVMEQEMEQIQEWMQTVSLEHALTVSCKEILTNHMNNAYMALAMHQIPEAESLPGGEMGIPRPGEQSFGIVLSTEIAQEQMVEVETEVDMESEVSLAKRNEDLAVLRPPFIEWSLPSFHTPLGLWKALKNSSNLFFQLHNTFPDLYQFATLSGNLGIWPNASEWPLHHMEVRESSFHWIHDAYIDPFVFHVILQHPTDGYRSLTISHQEYAEYIFPLLQKPGCTEYGNSYDPSIQPVVSVFRFEGWGWLEFDSTSCPLDGEPLNVEQSIFTRKILAENSLLSGYVELGSVQDQMDFLSLFVDSFESMTDIILPLFQGKYTSYFSKAVTDRVEAAINTKVCLTFEDQSILLSAQKDLLTQLPDSLQELAHSLPSSAIMKDFVVAMDKQISAIISQELLNQIFAKETNPEWNLLLITLFGTQFGMQKLEQAKKQVRVISSRHRPGIAKKLATSPMWNIICRLLKKCTKE